MCVGAAMGMDRVPGMYLSSYTGRDLVSRHVEIIHMYLGNPLLPSLNVNRAYMLTALRPLSLLCSCCATCSLCVVCLVRRWLQISLMRTH
jgi:hypothetical protein